MKREIKFRAWDKNRKEMFFGSPVYLYSGTKNGEFDYLQEYITGSHLSKLAHDGAFEFEVMQFTGLKDKNGKEIYEGDIVNVKTNHVSDLAPDREPTISTVEIKFERAMFVFGDMTMNYRPLQKAELEVIGNRFENPELLKL